MTLKANPIRTDSSNSFAHNTMKTRLPNIIRDVQAKNIFSDDINMRLNKLHDDVKSNALIPQPILPAPDADMWTAAFEEYPDARWQETEWFFAETYFFRQIAVAVRYWQTQLDPYHTIKNAELNQATYKRIINALEFEGDDVARINYLLEAALWGNRADLSHPAAAMQQMAINPDDLLVDNREPATQQLLDGNGTVHVVCDNFGAELAMDLVLTDALLSLEIPVILHVKMLPTYVSDATVKDVHLMLSWLGNMFEDAPCLQMWQRLTQALKDGRLQLAPDFFWNSPYFLNAMPPRLMQTFESSRMVILKGDMNYRRAVFDTMFPVDTPFADVVDYMPAPVLALRTLKSDAVVGVPVVAATLAEQEDEAWRVNGRHGVIQFVG